jgi:LVIVD repeat
MRRVLTMAVGLAAALVLASAAQGAADGPRVVVVDGGTVPGTAKHIRLLGHDPLFARGMNAAPAVLNDSGFVYVGSRTDGAPDHPNAGILVVDASDPSDPEVVNEIGPPFAANPSETTRELRIWQEQKILVVLTFTCSSVIHHCEGSVAPNFRFFDLSDPANPEFMMNFVPTQASGAIRTPHEFFLWVDPADPDRAYIWATLPTGSRNPAQPNLAIWDASGVASGTTPRLLAQGNWNQLYEAGSFDGRLANHSMDVSADGRTTTLAYQRGHTLVLDTAEVVDSPPPAGVVLDLNDNLLTSPANRPKWGTADSGCIAECAESHSAEQVPGRDLIINTDEIYGTFTIPFHGCPWGWVHVIDTSDPSTPEIVSEYKTTKNVCPADDPLTQQFTSYASHNPTVTEDLVLLTWHSAGFHVIDIANATKPKQAGWFSPTPLPAVTTEDPALNGGPNKVTMWSYPIVDDGLIYVVDLRNGLYILEYRGKFNGQIRRLDYLEGNSNQGDAPALDTTG